MSFLVLFNPRKRSAGGITACFIVLSFGGAAVYAQQSDGSAVPPSPTTQAAAPPVSAPLEDRIAAARTVKVITSILGIELGSELDEAHEKLDKLCPPGTRPHEEGGDGDTKEQKNQDQASGGPDKENVEQRDRKLKPGEEEEEGHKVLWTLAGTNYSAIYVTADDKERIDSITGFLRPEKQLPFGEVGQVAKAPAKDNSSVVWDVLRVGQPLFRVVAKGANGKANTIQMFIVRRTTGKAVPHGGDAGGKAR